ncbi:hypothetical protein R5R35_002989 [Gryllus longicercus]|uniref:Odorant binding protein n=1 Tax=Gryllus longicercus TaxID=2509291 RepID=A0AAN9W6J2_9ORTH
MRTLALTFALALAAASAPLTSAQLNFFKSFNGIFKCFSNYNLLEAGMENKDKTLQDVMTNPGTTIKCFTQCILTEVGAFNNGSCVKPKVQRKIDQGAELLKKVSNEIAEEWKSNGEACLNADYSANAEECSGAWDMMLCLAKNDMQALKKLMDSGDVQKLIQEHLIRLAAKYMLG